MKKKIILSLSAIILAFGMVGCDSKNQNNDVSSNSGISAEQEKQLIDAAVEIDEHKALPQLDGVKQGDTIATIHTNKGDIKVWFFPDYAPKAVENFTTHAKNGYYNGVKFHRVINDFMIQGGDPKGNGTGGESIWNSDFENEVSLDLRSFRGALCMANAGPDTNGSQFYIVQNNQGEQWANAFKNMDGSQPYSTGAQVFKNSKNELLTGNDVYTQDVIDAYSELGGYPSLDLGYTIFGQVYEGMDIVDSIASVQTNESDKPLEDIILESIEVGTY